MLPLLHTKIRWILTHKYINAIQHSDLHVHILFYSALFKNNVSRFSGLTLNAPWSPGCNLQVLARAPRRPEKTVREWHADRCAPPPPPLFLLLLLRFELLPRRDDWHRAVHTANQSAPRFICIEWPHAIGLVRATANRLACHYRRLLLGGARGVLKIDKMCMCSRFRPRKCWCLK